MTVQEFSASIGISYDTVWRAAKDGRLKTIRFGKRLLIPIEEVDRIMNGGLVENGK
jgi:excisionase family DNA binding protein